MPEQGQLFKYDRLAVNVIVNNIDGGINSCDIPFTDDLDEFSTDYINLTLSAKKALCKQFPGRHDGDRDIGDDGNRTGQHRQPVHRPVLQPDGDVGKIPQKVAEGHLTHFLPVPPRADGRRPRRPIPQRTPTNNKHPENLLAFSISEMPSRSSMAANADAKSCLYRRLKECRCPQKTQIDQLFQNGIVNYSCCSIAECGCKNKSNLRNS